MDHDKYMRMAMARAEDGDSPFGSVVVKEGRVVATGCNTVKTDRDPTSHSELKAVRAACRELGTTNLQGCVLYTNVEPCPMCMGAIIWARVSKVVYGASTAEVAEFVPSINITCREVAAHAPYRIEVIGGVLSDLCLAPFRLMNL